MILDEYLSAKEMRAVEMNTEYLGVSRLQLMENAGKAVADIIMTKFESKTKVVIACGLGGNGGDGFVAARHLASAGFDIEVLLLGREENLRSQETILNWNTLKNMTNSLKIQEIHDSSEIKSLEADVLVDALIGTGIKGPLTSPFKEMVHAINMSDCYKIAVDIPSGLDSDSGEVYDEAVLADLTLTFHKPKKGFRNTGQNIGDLVTNPIGIPSEAEVYAGPGDVYLATRPRFTDAHKGDFGRVLVIGGSETYSGAPTLTAMGAYSVGVDLVYVAAPETSASIIAGFSPSLITLKLKGEKLSEKNHPKIISFLDRVDAVAIGPGLGMHQETINAVNKIIEGVQEHNLPILIDADAIKGFSQSKRRISADAVLTPHRGEFQILTGKKSEGDYKKIGEIVKKEASKLGITILLKGHIDIVSNGIHIRYNLTGNPGMTVGGTGDVLSGIVVGFMAMGISPFEAAVGGAFINGSAGDAVYKEKGYHIEPHDLIPKIPLVIENALKGGMKTFNI